MIQSLEIEVHGEKMEDDMKYFTIQVTYDALACSTNNVLTETLAEDNTNNQTTQTLIQSKLDEKYGEKWHYMVGSAARLAIDRIEFYLTLSIKGVSVMVWKPYST